MLATFNKWVGHSLTPLLSSYACKCKMLKERMRAQITKLFDGINHTKASLCSVYVLFTTMHV